MTELIEEEKGVAMEMAMLVTEESANKVFTVIHLNFRETRDISVRCRHPAGYEK